MVQVKSFHFNLSDLSFSLVLDHDGEELFVPMTPSEVLVLMNVAQSAVTSVVSATEFVRDHSDVLVRKSVPATVRSVSARGPLVQ